jgi:N-methylhydantoinase B
MRENGAMAAYFRPGTLAEALALRAERPVTVLAGGTDLYPAQAGRVGWGDMRRPDILDVGAIADLGGIADASDHFRFGALSTWSDLIAAPLPPAFDGYKAAAREVGGRQVQNRGTLVGNVCTASPAGDGAPCLLSLGAAVELASAGGRRVVPIEDFIDGYRHTLCRADEIVTAILVPKPKPAARGAFAKLGARRYLVISIVMAAAVVEAGADGVIRGARLAVGACSPVARRLPALEEALVGRPLANAADAVAHEHFAALQPIDDIRGSAEYRRAAAVEVLSDLLAGLAAAPTLRAA